MTFSGLQAASRRLEAGFRQTSISRFKADLKQAVSLSHVLPVSHSFIMCKMYIAMQNKEVP